MAADHKEQYNRQWKDSEPPAFTAWFEKYEGKPKDFEHSEFETGIYWGCREYALKGWLVGHAHGVDESIKTKEIVKSLYEV